MLGQLNALLAELSVLAGPLGWLTLAVFVAAIALEYVDQEYARYSYVGAWVLFGAFWFTLVQPFFVEDESVIRGIGAVLAVPLSLLVAKTLYEGRDSLFTLSRAIVFMGVIYVPFLLITPMRNQLILLVTNHTAFAMDLIGYDPTVITTLDEVGVERELTIDKPPLENTFYYPNGEGSITYTIILACTGIGSMAVIVGLIAAVRAPLRRKLQATALVVPVIYVLNIVRNVFIGVSYGNQYMHFFPDATMTVFGLDNPVRVSYIWADRILAQSASVVALVLIIWAVVKILPEVLGPIEDVLYLLTGQEHDLAAALNLDREPTPDPAD